MRRRQPIAHESVQVTEPTSSQTTAEQTAGVETHEPVPENEPTPLQTTAVQTDEADAREIQLLKNERLYEERSSVLAQNWQRLGELTSKYNAELADMSKLEARLNRIREEEAFYQERKTQLAREIIEIGNAGKELFDRRVRLQQEMEQFKNEKDELKKLKVDQGTQTESLEWMPDVTSVTLSERFSKKQLVYKRVVMGDDGNITIALTAASEEN